MPVDALPLLENVQENRVRFEQHDGKAGDTHTENSAGADGGHKNERVFGQALVSGAIPDVELTTPSKRKKKRKKQAILQLGLPECNYPHCLSIGVEREEAPELRRCRIPGCDARFHFLCQARQERKILVELPFEGFICHTHLVEEERKASEAGVLSLTLEDVANLGDSVEGDKKGGSSKGGETSPRLTKQQVKAFGLRKRIQEMRSLVMTPIWWKSAMQNPLWKQAQQTSTIRTTLGKLFGHKAKLGSPAADASTAGAAAPEERFKYQLAGPPASSTKRMMARANMLQSEMVKNVMMQWWHVMTDSTSGEPLKEHLFYNEYIIWSICLMKAHYRSASMLPALSAIQGDMLLDTKRTSQLPMHQAFDILFVLAEHFAEAFTVESISEYLERLLLHITVEAPDGEEEGTAHGTEAVTAVDSGRPAQGTAMAGTANATPSEVSAGAGSQAMQQLPWGGKEQPQGGIEVLQGRDESSQGGKPVGAGGKPVGMRNPNWRKGSQLAQKRGSQLAQGGSQLAQGGSQLAQGESQLAQGGSQLAQGSSQLSQGRNQAAQEGGQQAQRDAGMGKSFVKRIWKPVIDITSLLYAVEEEDEALKNFTIDEEMQMVKEGHSLQEVEEERLRREELVAEQKARQSQAKMAEAVMLKKLKFESFANEWLNKWQAKQLAKKAAEEAAAEDDDDEDLPDVQSESAPAMQKEKKKKKKSS
ncbi:hypothetical protein CYMTET_56669, partial [Cymbomonas tetramitiformis]